MTIDKILFVADNNPAYLGFWPSISKFYSRYYDMRPHLFFLNDGKALPSIDTSYGDVTIVDAATDTPIIIQALWGKFWFTQTEPNTTWLIGDIDLYLLNRDYLQTALRGIGSEDYGHINANGYKMGNWWQAPKYGLPGYFHCAKGSVFQRYLSLSNSFADECRFIRDSKRYGILYNGIIQNPEAAPQRVKDKADYGYICCEEHLSTERLIPLADKIIGYTYPSYLTRLETPHATRGVVTPSDFDFRTIFDSNMIGSYIDFHAPRPYSVFGDRIEEVLQHYV